MDTLKNFQIEEYKKLLFILTQSKTVEKEQADTIVHALVDIAGSIEKIYSTILPKIMSEVPQNKDNLLENLWDLGEEFRHIEYHIQDARFTEF